MRPLRLEIEGFATFRDRTVLDFADLDLVAFVGPTGAGKSTVIDAMIFALYGSVPRYDNANVVAPVIHQLSTEAKVRFDFEVGGQHYVAVRIVRRRGAKSKLSGQRGQTDPMASSTGASTKEARLERIDGGASVEVLAGNVRELDEAVNQLIGLDFGQFTRTVVLPQGEFAQFLRDEPASRQRLLRDLLELQMYAHMGVVARDSAKKAALQAEALEQELGRQTLISDQAIVDLETVVDQMDTIRSAAEGQLQALADIDQELGPLRERVEAIDQQRGRLSAVAVPDGLEQAAVELAAAAEAVTEADEVVEQARTAWEQAQQALQELPDAASISNLLAVGDQLQAELTRLDTAQSARTAEGERQQKAEAAHGEAEEAFEAARAALDTARSEAAAGAWVAKLVTGEPCPVCQHTVEAIPDHPHDDALELAEREAKQKRQQLDEAAAERAAAQGVGVAAEAEANRLQASVADLRTKLDGIDLKEIKAQQEQRTALDAQARALLAELKSGQDSLDRAALAAKQLKQSQQQSAVDLARQREALADLKPPIQEHESMLDDWTSLAQWSEDLDRTLATEREEKAGRGKELAADRAKLLDHVAELVGPANVDPEPLQLLERLAVVKAEQSAKLQAARDRAEDQQRVRRRIDELRADQQLDATLGRHLSASGFEGWLLNEALDNIVAGATAWLRDLSGGSYSLAVSDREFAIIDHNNADEWRDVRTLSGGETFLASLSLALALADSIAELAPVDAPRLESMFLDEGFGTLDATTLDVVASAIEELASTGRMIGIVTHVRDLAERMPARFEVAKSPVGSTVELVEV